MLDWNKVLYFAEVLQFGGIPWLSEMSRWLRDFLCLKIFFEKTNQIECVFRFNI